MLTQVPQRFDSSTVEPSDRLSAFSRFVDTNPHLGFNEHRMLPISTEGPEIHRVARVFGNGIGVSRVETTGHKFSTPTIGAWGGRFEKISLCCVNQGTIELRSQKEHAVLRAGDLYIMEPTEKLYSIGPGVATRLLLPRDAYMAGLLGPDRILKIQSSTPMARLLKSMIVALSESLSQPSSPSAQNPLQDIAKQMVTRLLEAEKGGDTRHNPIRDRVRDFVIENLAKTDLSPKDISDYLGMSRASLYRAFSGTDGVMAFVTETRLSVARSLLSTSDVKRGRIHEVAYLCGFKSPSSFNQAFKKAYGSTPSMVGGNKEK